MNRLAQLAKFSRKINKRTINYVSLIIIINGRYEPSKNIFGN
jgi:hypothetical protein